MKENGNKMKRKIIKKVEKKMKNIK